MELRRRTCPGRVELLDHDGRAERAAACAARRRRVDRRRSLLRWFAGDAVGAQPNEIGRAHELQSLAYLVCRLLLEKKKKERRPQLVVDVRVFQDHVYGDGGVTV